MLSPNGRVSTAVVSWVRWSARVGLSRRLYEPGIAIDRRLLRSDGYSQFVSREGGHAYCKVFARRVDRTRGLSRKCEFPRTCLKRSFIFSAIILRA